MALDARAFAAPGKGRCQVKEEGHIGNDYGFQEAERQHHPFSPSKLGYLEVCPAYEGTNVVHEKATTGTRQHAVVETQEDDHRLTDEESSAAAECLAFVASRRQLMEEARQRAVDEADQLGAPEADRQFSRVEELTEVWLKVDDIDMEVPVFDVKAGGFRVQRLTCTTSGFVDKVLVDHIGERAELVDYKFGAWAVEDAATNIQGISYVLGLFYARPTVKEITCFFKQPALERTTSATFTRDQIPDLYARVKTIVARKIESNKRGDFSMACPTHPACMFCARLGSCTKASELFLKISQKYSPLVVPESVNTSLIHSPTDTSMAMKLAAVATSWADAFKKQTLSFVLMGRAPVPPGYSLQTRSEREVADAAKFKQIALTHLTEAEYETTLSITLGAVEKLVSSKAPRGAKTAMLDAFKGELETSGAIVKGQPYCFLKSDPKAKTTEKENA